MWKPQVNKFENIPIDSYRIILSNSKERFEEVISESESITNKCISLIQLVVLIGAAIIGYGLTMNYCVFFIYIIFYSIDLRIILGLLFPKGVIPRGTHPNTISWDDVESEENNEDERIKVTYYHEIIRLGDSIDKMECFNKKRQVTYKTSLIMSYLLFIVGIITLFISHP